MLRSTGAALMLAFLNFGYLPLILLHVITLDLLEPLLINVIKIWTLVVDDFNVVIICPVLAS